MSAMMLVCTLMLSNPPGASPLGPEPDSERTSQKVRENPGYQAYLRQREAVAPSDAADHYDLSLWCKERSLNAEARAHAAVAATLQPTEAKYQKALGRTLRGRVWMSASEWRESLDDLNATKLITRDWETKLRQLERDGRLRDAGRFYTALRGMKTPVAIPTIERFLQEADEPVQLVGIVTMGKLHHQEATDFLIRMAVDGPRESVRTAAAQQLSGRNPQYYVPRLVEHLSGGRVETGVMALPQGGLNGRHALAWYTLVGGRKVLEVFDVAGDPDLAAERLADWKGAGLDQTRLKA
ncbi:MAG: HEAT repeat domain-containing protein, partial [Gemmataceae bacterium]